ncbi:kinase-like domain-containing protein, partial [Mycena floridula]
DTKSLVRIRRVTVSKQTPSALGRLTEEYLAMRYLHHPNLVNYVDVFKYQGPDEENLCLWVIVEHLPEIHTVRKVVSANIGQPDSHKEGFIRGILRSLLDAVDYLHRHNVIHGFINSENVVLTRSGRNALPVRLRKFHPLSWSPIDGIP